LERSAERKMKLTLQGAWLLSLIAAGAAFVLDLGVRSKSFQLGYAVDEATAENRKLSERRRLWEVERQMLRDPRRIRLIAERTLQMGPPLPMRTDASVRAGGAR
jgi:hypothetical protein